MNKAMASVHKFTFHGMCNRAERRCAGEGMRAAFEVGAPAARPAQLRRRRRRFAPVSIWRVLQRRKKDGLEMDSEEITIKDC
jgi:hypothetical protein